MVGPLVLHWQGAISSGRGHWLPADVRLSALRLAAAAPLASSGSIANSSHRSASGSKAFFGRAFELMLRNHISPLPA